LRRRCFDHLHAELSVRLGRVAPRYALWLHLRAMGADPEHLSRADALRFLREDLRAFLAEHDLVLAVHELRSLERSIARLDPRIPTPAEWAARV
jgi:hypothetical protein